MSEERIEDAGGVSAGWVVALVITLTLGLGTVFFMVANSQPIELVDVSTRVGSPAPTQVGTPVLAPTQVAPVPDVSTRVGTPAPTQVGAPVPDAPTQVGTPVPDAPTQVGTPMRVAPTNEHVVPR